LVEDVYTKTKTSNRDIIRLKQQSGGPQLLTSEKETIKGRQYCRPCHIEIHPFFELLKASKEQSTLTHDLLFVHTLA
jgi:hypothetical protein